MKCGSPTEHDLAEIRFIIVVKLIVVKEQMWSSGKNGDIESEKFQWRWMGFCKRNKKIKKNINFIIKYL